MTNPVFPPLVHMQDNRISGYEAELFLRFCAKYGYDYRHTVASFDTAMAGVSTGQFDLGFCAVEYKPERAEHFLFSERTCEADCVLVVRSDGDTGLGPLALGFSERQAFGKFIIPQALRHAFPTYQAEIVGLLKSTAIVGYIAVQDLTKMADIIRAQTFDAFAPLIVITVLYLAFVWLLQKITNLVLKKLNPKGRTREEILKGVAP